MSILPSASGSSLTESKVKFLKKLHINVFKEAPKKKMQEYVEPTYFSHLQVGQSRSLNVIDDKSALPSEKSEPVKPIESKQKKNF